ncbi:ROK family transcriptional regulator [Fimbriiglobus ruber]|uniref:N-acetylglucosamine-6P-responsive transcriptional repressor NagC, ROK family n=1 Tax=Fimbriiglobus ruber TaxID=1908690 RepID=A0A225DPC6_9BACT|nr:ROK family transcriptional regulator [Fimbriiglobus ruber]OWK38017.1 N-acetylglucosamine-6P-responsive transcriptional repressor NagC, ROK family [Fimbriiglobus ruber]
MSLIPALRPSQVGKLNERQVLRVIQSRGPLSRAEVARQSGLSAPTVSKAVASLIVAGLLEEAEPDDSAPGRGRPAPKLRVASAWVQVLGVVIDAGHCTVTSAGLDGVMHPESLATVPTPRTYAALLTALTTRCRAAVDKPGVTTLGLGLSLPGLIDHPTGTGVLSPNVPITNGQTPAADLGTRLGLPAVHIQESHALCLAERDHGLAVGLTDFAMMDASTGIGLGVMSGGRLLLGTRGLAGELGHMTVVAENGPRCGCGNEGCLEAIASDAALATRVAARVGEPVSVDDVVEMARAGRPEVAAELPLTARYLAIGVGTVINLFNPSTVFIHSRLFEAVPGLFEQVVELARGRSLPPTLRDCEIVRARGNKPQGAVAGIVQHLTNAVAPGLEHV